MTDEKLKKIYDFLKKEKINNRVYNGTILKIKIE